MASLLKDTMDSSFGGYDCPIMGYQGSDQLPPFQIDACHGVDLFAVFEPATVHTSTTENFGFDHGILGQDSACTGSLLESEDILGYDIMAPEIDSNGVFDLESLVAETQLPVHIPSSARMDTQPQTSAIATSSLADFSFSSWKMPCETSAPGSPDSGIYSVESPGSIQTSEDEPSPCATPAPVAVGKTQATPDLCVSAEDIKYLETLLEESAYSGVSATQCLSSHSIPTISVESCAKLSRKSQKPSIRPSKSLSSTEKKDRKRAQNKNAATRYREKKRAEAKVVCEEQTKMEDKNRDLKDKVTLLTREIQYMKELLIEVYKTKGLVE